MSIKALNYAFRTAHIKSFLVSDIQETRTMCARGRSWQIYGTSCQFVYPHCGFIVHEYYWIWCSIPHRAWPSQQGHDKATRSRQVFSPLHILISTTVTVNPSDNLQWDGFVCLFMYYLLSAMSYVQENSPAQHKDTQIVMNNWGRAESGKWRNSLIVYAPWLICSFKAYATRLLKCFCWPT